MFEDTLDNLDNLCPTFTAPFSLNGYCYEFMTLLQEGVLVSSGVIFRVRVGVGVSVRQNLRDGFSRRLYE